MQASGPEPRRYHPDVIENPYRLPRAATPSHYRLRLEPDLDAATFRGTCRATVTVHVPTAELVCNAAELEVTRAHVESTDGPIACTISLDEDHERATFGPATTLAPGEYVLVTHFDGVLNDKLRGFYRSSFSDTDGATHVLATTQFESTNARRAFPCWDEPDLKAVFDVTLVVDPDLLAISCGRQISSEMLEDGRREVRFAPTMLLSTYLVAFMVGPLEASDPVHVSDTSVRIIHVPGKDHLIDFAKEAAAFSLAHFEEYFAIPYPGDKLDLLAIPDFASGAMENLGAVTFREILLLLDPQRSTQREQQRSVDVIAHEIAHMWFGDLVTMKWWEGIWLKEAFATFMEMHATNAWRPDWERWVDFGLSRSAAFDVDALAETRPIEYPVVSPADAEGMYDLLTYEKGAAVVRMLEQYLTPTVFRDGVRYYLASHAYGSTETTDLWDDLEHVSNQPVRRIMDSWIFQGGHPLVSIDLVDDTRVHLRQRRFRYDGVESGEQWGVPIVLRVYHDGASRSVPVLLESPDAIVEVGAHDAVLVNADASGFYRVDYSPAAATALAGLPPGAVAPIERYGLIDDAWAALVAGVLDPAAYLDLVQTFVDDDDLSVWQRILGTLHAIDHLLADDARGAYAAWVRRLLGPLLDRLGPDPAAEEDDRTGELRAAAFGTLGTIGVDGPTIERAAALLDDESADASLRAAAVGVVASVADTGRFDDLVRRFRDAETPQDERRYSYALAAVPGLADFERLLAMTVDGTIRTQDAPFVLALAMGNRHHGPRAWTHVVDNWAFIVSAFPSTSMVYLLGGIRSLSIEPLAAEIESFCLEHPLDQGAKTIAQHLERLRVNVGLRARVRDRVPTVLG